MVKPSSELSPQLLSRIAEAIRSVQHGSVQIIIHDSWVVQIERAEKIRLQQCANLTSGGSLTRSSQADQATEGERPLEGN